jgi:hypothetical protein
MLFGGEQLRTSKLLVYSNIYVDIPTTGDAESGWWGGLVQRWCLFANCLAKPRTPLQTNLADLRPATISCRLTCKVHLLDHVQSIIVWIQEAIETKNQPSQCSSFSSFYVHRTGYRIAVDSHRRIGQKRGHSAFHHIGYKH